MTSVGMSDSNAGILATSPVADKLSAQDMQIRDLRPRDSNHLLPFREQKRIEQ
jgi:hypothetical protein